MNKLTLEQRSYLQLLQALCERGLHYSGYDYNIECILDEGLYDEAQRNVLNNTVSSNYKQYLKKRK